MKKISLLCFFNVMVVLVGFAQTSNRPDALLTAISNFKGPKAEKTYVVNGDEMSPINNMLQNMQQAKGFSTLVKCINAAILGQTLNGTGPLTIFAPSNDAFNTLKPGYLDTLLKPAHNQELIALVTGHVVTGKLRIKDLNRRIAAGKGQYTLVTLAGTKLILTADANRDIVVTDEWGRQSMISHFDAEQSNGMLHTVNAVLMPKSN